MSNENIIEKGSVDGSIDQLPNFIRPSDPEIDLGNPFTPCADYFITTDTVYL